MKYHYEYEVRASNLNYGGLFIGRFRSIEEAECAGRCANRGAFSIRKVRVYMSKTLKNDACCANCTHEDNGVCTFNGCCVKPTDYCKRFLMFEKKED